MSKLFTQASINPLITDTLASRYDSNEEAISSLIALVAFDRSLLPRACTDAGISGKWPHIKDLSQYLISIYGKPAMTLEFYPRSDDIVIYTIGAEFIHDMNIHHTTGIIEAYEIIYEKLDFQFSFMDLWDADLRRIQDEIWRR